MTQEIFIDSDGTVSKITDKEGAAIHGVRKAVVSMETGKPTTAVLELITRFTGKAAAEFVVRDPTTGLLKPVDRIEFTDGTTFPPHD